MAANIRHFIPYVYLKSATTLSLCDLFVAVRIPIGFELVASNQGQGITVDAQNNTNIEIKVKKSQQPGRDAIHKGRYTLPLPGDRTLSNAFVEVTVLVLDEQELTMGSYSNRMLYRDRDMDTDPGLANENIAYNCPYIYLEGPSNTGNGTSAHVVAQTRYQPHVLLFPRGYRLLSNEVQITSPENGIFESFIFLSKDESVGPNAAPIVDLAANQSHYYDTGGQEGNFLVTVILEDNIDLPDSISQTKETARHQALKQLEDQAVADALGNTSSGGATGPGPGDAGEPPIEEEGEEGGVAMRTMAPRTAETSSPPRRKRKKAKTRNLGARPGLSPER